MQIKNDYKALDKALKQIDEQLERLRKSNQAFQKDLESLHAKGWQDKNYIQLKQVISQEQAKLQNVIQGIEQMKQELHNRSKLLKSYYAIQF
jgi:hypothetical protein